MSLNHRHMAVKRVLFGLLGLGAVTQGSVSPQVPCDSSEEDRRRITESAVHALRQDGRFYVLQVRGLMPVTPVKLLCSTCLVFL